MKKTNNELKPKEAKLKKGEFKVKVNDYRGPRFFSRLTRAIRKEMSRNISLL